MNVSWINLPRILVLCALCFGAVACTRPDLEGTQRVLIPWPDGNGSYSLQEVELHSLQSVNEVRGSSADIYIDPSTQGTSLSGDRPSAHYMQSEDGLIVPKDFHTYQFFGLYAHAEKLWEFDAATGAADLLPRPRKYGFGVRERSGAAQKNNAFFLNALDAILILPFDGSGQPDNKQLPMSLNAGIMAHEHFHAIFNSAINHAFTGEAPASGCHNAILTGDLSDFMPRGKQAMHAYKNWNEFLLQAMNEGLADVWGWLYSRDPNFISHSVPSVEAFRSLDTKASGPVWTKSAYVNERMNPDVGFDDTDIYELGTYFARRIRMDAVSNGIDNDAAMRMRLAQHIVSVLRKWPAVVTQLNTISGRQDLEIEDVIRAFELPKGMSR